MNGRDDDGRWFGIDDALAIGIGAIAGGVTACMNGHCSATDGKFWAYVGGGAAIGEAALYTGGAAAGLAAGAGGGAVATGVAAGVAGGAVAGAGNYTLGSGVETGFSNFSGSGLWNATWTAAAAGGVGGGVGGLIGGGAIGAFSSGFAGGATGSYLNGARGMDVVYGGLLGGAITTGAYSAKWGYNEYLRPGDLDAPSFSDGKANGNVPKKPIGSVSADEWEKLAIDDFKDYHSDIPSNIEPNGESGVTYRRTTSWLTGDPSIKVLDYGQHSGPNTPAKFGGDMYFHSHPYNPYFSSGDYTAAGAIYGNNGGYSYLLAPDNSSVFRVLPSTHNNFVQVRY